MSVGDKDGKGRKEGHLGRKERRTLRKEGREGN